MIIMKKPDFKKYFYELKENPGKIFGLTYIYIMIAGFMVGIYYINNLGNVERQTVPPSLADSTHIIEELKITEPGTIPAIDLKEVEKPGEPLLETGKNLYMTACLSCHGENGMGDGLAGSSLNPKPRNFHNNEGWINGSTLTGIYKTIEEGIAGSGMISFSYFQPREKLALAQYIRSNFVNNATAVTTDELTLLDQTYNLSAGSKIAGQIPVKNAMEIYLKENRSKTERIINSLRKLSGMKDEGGELFDQLVTDKIQAVTALTQSTEWKRDKNKMKALILTSINRNGFNGEVFKLNEDEWSILYKLLTEII